MPPAERRFVVDASEEGERLDRFLATRCPDLSRSYIQKLSRQGMVLIDAQAGRPSQSVRASQVVLLEIPEAVSTSLVPEAIPLAVLFEDDDLLVLDKPAGLVVHPGAGARTGTLVHALLSRAPNWSTIGGEERPGIVHRLDRGTSGVMVVARHDRAHRSLSAQFKDRTVEKIYAALVWGRIDKGTFTIDLPLGRDASDRKKISSRTSKPRTALTEFRVTERFESCTLVEARPKTGRTHQIRAHLRSCGHPIVGDAAYGGDRRRSLPPGPLREALETFRRLALHAFRLTFDHPRDGRRLTFEAPLPGEMASLVETLRAEGAA